jgi:hypothetical protein
MQLVINRTELEVKTNNRRRIRLVPYCQNLLIPLDLSRLRQLVINVVSRMLTEALLDGFDQLRRRVVVKGGKPKHVVARTGKESFATITPR